MITSAPSPATAPLTSAWQQGNLADPPSTGLVGSATADVAIVGGGLAGLSVAYHLHRADPSLGLILLEAVTVASGSSGRSTGIAGPGIGGSISLLRRRYGPDTARAMYAESLDYVDRTVELVGAAQLDCGLREGVQLTCALTERQSAALGAQARDYGELGFDVPLLGSDELKRYVRAKRYRAGLRHPKAATLDPFQLCRGLRDYLIAAGVAVFEHSPVLGLGAGRPIELRTRDGCVRASRVVLATDSHTALAGRIGTAVTPMVGHVVRTAPLDHDQLNAIGLRQGDSVVDPRSFFDYYRLTPDGRLVLGGGRVAVPGPADRGHAPDPATAARAWRRLERELSALFPDLGPVELTERWTGRMGATLDRLPVVGRLPDLPGVWYAGAWCGHGIALSVGSGARLAEQLTGAEPPRLPWLRGRGPRLPPQAIRAAGLRLYVRGLDLVDRPRLERRARGSEPARTGAVHAAA